VTPAVAVDAAELADFHGDPADRLIVSSAKSLKVPLVTKDSKIVSYAKTTKLFQTAW
jgi:PIN domain nuclease of toxin-antitoxin system